MSERAHKQGERQRQREQPTPSWTGIPMWGLIPGPRDGDPSHRGIPHFSVYGYRAGSVLGLLGIKILRVLIQAVVKNRLAGSLCKYICKYVITYIIYKKYKFCNPFVVTSDGAREVIPLVAFGTYGGDQISYIILPFLCEIFLTLWFLPCFQAMPF